MAFVRCGDREGVEDAADGLVGADERQNVGDALCAEVRVGLVVCGLFDAPPGGQWWVKRQAACSAVDSSPCISPAASARTTRSGRPAERATAEWA